MKRAATALFIVVAACGNGGSGDIDAGVGDAGPAFATCEASDQSFVRNAFVGLLGRRPLSNAESLVYTDLMGQIRELADSVPGEGEPDAAVPVPDVDPKQVVARAIMDNPEFSDRWADHFKDSLMVPRIEVQGMRSCYGDTERDPDDGDLAQFVRDNGAMAGSDGGAPFTMLDLLESALALDDLSPVYRGHVFALMSRPIPAANVPRIQAELARREDFGLVFDATYLNRDIVCLGCHNSSGSVTEHPDPALSRHWALPGHVDLAVYGVASGIEPERAHAVFRYDGFSADIFQGDIGDHRPWDWDTSCGGFYPFGLEDDPASVDGFFAGLTGQRLTVYDLEASLGRGFEVISTSGLPIDDNGDVGDPDAAFAYMVSAKIVETVWEEVIGSPLTIANYFPRNEASRDLLHELTDSFISSSFSLKTLLVDIVSTPYFNRLEPAAGCDSPYNMPPVYDPWVITDDDPERHQNGAGDSVSALSARTLISAAYSALEWNTPFFSDFPQQPSSINTCDNFFSCSQMEQACANDGNCCLAHEYLCVNPPTQQEPTAGESRSFQRGIGVFLKNGERGFRGLDFQARLVFEDRFGACDNPTRDLDFIDKVEQLAIAEAASLGDVVAALKDRVVSFPRVSHEPIGPGGTSELAALEALFAATLDTQADTVAGLNTKMRQLCGALLSSPQFLLGGLAAPDNTYVPLLTPDEHSYSSVCTQVSGRGLDAALSISCSPDSLTISPL